MLECYWPVGLNVTNIITEKKCTGFLKIMILYGPFWGQVIMNLCFLDYSDDSTVVLRGHNDSTVVLRGHKTIVGFRIDDDEISVKKLCHFIWCSS